METKYCGKCEQDLPIGNFRERRDDKRRPGVVFYNSACKRCEHRYRRQYYGLYRGRRKELARKYYLSGKKKRPPVEQVRAWTTQYRQSLKLAAMVKYSAGNMRPACVCCGEMQIHFLTIDHVNNDGAEQRKMIRAQKKDMYAWLKVNKYPAGFQTLCWNCNLGKSLNKGICPHRGLIE